MTELHEMGYDELNDHVKDAIKEMRRKAYAEGYGQGKFDARMGDVIQDRKLREISETILTPEKLAKLDQKKRDEIVAKAKADVYDLLKERQISADEMEYITDQKRRVVVAKIKHLFSGFTLTEGIAKCNPDDCFNVHIGKAIALRRALGLDLPSYYLNVPNPTEVHINDCVKVTLNNGGVEIKPVKELRDSKLNVDLPGRVVQYPSTYVEILDDSRE